MIQESTGWTGEIRVTARYKDGTVEVHEFKNMITDAGKNLLRNVLQGTVLDGGIRYMAWGSGTAAPAGTDVQLGAEAGRKIVTKKTAGSTGALVTTVYLAPFDAVMQIRELGWFAGTGATSIPNSGVMVARVLFNKLKTNLESIQIDRTDTIL